MYALMLIDESTGKRLTWRPQTPEQEMEIANLTMTLSMSPDGDEPTATGLVHHQAS